MNKKNFKELMYEYISDKNKDNYFSKRIHLEILDNYVVKKNVKSILIKEGNDFAYPDNYIYHYDIPEIKKREGDLILNTKILDQVYFHMYSKESRKQLFEEMLKNVPQFHKLEEIAIKGKFKDNDPDFISLEEMYKEFNKSLDKIYIPIEGLVKKNFTDDDELTPELLSSDLMKTLMNSHFIPKEDIWTIAFIGDNLYQAIELLEEGLDNDTSPWLDEVPTFDPNLPVSLIDKKEVTLSNKEIEELVLIKFTLNLPEQKAISSKSTSLEGKDGDFDF